MTTKHRYPPVRRRLLDSIWKRAMKDLPREYLAACSALTFEEFELDSQENDYLGLVSERLRDAIKIAIRGSVDKKSLAALVCRAMVIDEVEPGITCSNYPRLKYEADDVKRMFLAEPQETEYVNPTMLGGRYYGSKPWYARFKGQHVRLDGLLMYLEQYGQTIGTLPIVAFGSDRREDYGRCWIVPSVFLRDGKRVLGEFQVSTEDMRGHSHPFGKGTRFLMIRDV